MRWLGAVQAQEYPDAKWALALRMRRATEAAIERAFADGRILRTHILRPTWHFVAPDDIRWMLALTGPSVSRRMAPYNRRLELDPAIFRRSEKAIVRALQDGVHLTRQELKTALQRAGISVDNGQRLAHIVMQAELDAVITSGPRNGRQFTYALLDDRVPASRMLSRDDALAELARRYFTSHGPAQLQDFAWWSGLRVPDARAGLAMVDGELARDTFNAKSYWFSRAVRAHASPAATHLLPLYDEYVIAYKDRSDILDNRRLWTWTIGNSFGAPVVANGRVAGLWRRRMEGDKVVVFLSPFGPLSRRDKVAIAAAAENYGEFVGLSLDLQSATM